MLELSLIISIIALVLSLVSFWMNSLTPFELKIRHSAPTFSLYEITPGISGAPNNQKWWIPSFDIGVSLYNKGKQSGEIKDFRIKGSIEIAQSKKEQEVIFYPKWIVNYAKYQKDCFNRFAWIESSVEREWYSIILNGDSEKHIHLILEDSRWDEIIEGKMVYTLETFSSDRNKWRTLANFEMLVTKDLFETRSKYTVPCFDKLTHRSQ